MLKIDTQLIPIEYVLKFNDPDNFRDAYSNFHIGSISIFLTYLKFQIGIIYINSIYGN
jgi:hypothetical protein